MPNKNLHDEPLFDSSDGSQSSSTEKLSMEKLKQSGRNYNKLLTLGNKWVKWFLIFAAVIIVLDIVCQKMGVNSELLKEAFSLAKYSLTTILGFVFANSANK